jgi:hypothetical protein
MMESFIIALVFIALAINVPTMIAYLIGLKFQITDYGCPEEVKSVKTNILMTKIVQVFNVIVFGVIMVLLNL